MTAILVGTSGFGYNEWKGRFYPQELPDKEMLSYYASKFATVEIDSTFYRMPAPGVLQGWAASVPAHFRFVIKASQQITHRQRLRVPSEALNHLNSVVGTLGDQLAFVAYQLPPFSKCDLPRLQAFLEVLPLNMRSSFEFRHPSWFVPEVYDLLKHHGAILCVHDTDEGCSPMETTAKTVYVRLRRTRYAPHELDEWKARWRHWAASGFDVFAYVKHKDNPDAPQIALQFAEGF
ncbi:MAG TPA: DUF72 domain-containing protein [Terriglobia bacterium]|nr:DUF72 domain-containing protein [Terriglobia bacterium]